MFGGGNGSGSFYIDSVRLYKAPLAPSQFTSGSRCIGVKQAGDLTGEWTFDKGDTSDSSTTRLHGSWRVGRTKKSAAA